MEFIKSSRDCLLEDNEDGTYTVCMLKPWAAIQRVYLDDSNYYEHLFDNLPEAEEFYNWTVENDDDNLDVSESVSDCCA